MLQLIPDAAKNKLTHIFIERTGFHGSLENIYSGCTSMEINF